MFDDLTDVYEAMIDWPKRLANESPFYRTLFERVQARRVVDVACGSGHHAALFSSWGLAVEAADLSPAMIGRAALRETGVIPVEWIVRGFDQPVSAPGGFDVAVCVGNSLALALDEAMLETAVRRMFEAVRPGGAVVVQLLNLWRLPDGPCVWQKCRRAVLPGVLPGRSEVMIVKGVHRVGRTGYVDLVVAPWDRPEQWRHESTQFWGVESADLVRLASDGGAASTELFGDYQFAPYAREKSTDLILVGIRGE